MVGEFEDAFWAWEVCDFGVHQRDTGFNWCEYYGSCGLGVKEKGLEERFEVSKRINHQGLRKSENWIIFG